jgi:2-amino-4-hydroxy-6-hydroxymethyldihydropteridine diphosphokinase
MEKLTEVLFSLGSNLGNRNSYLEQAIEEINDQIGRVDKTSEIYECEPIGFEADTNFLNLCIKVETTLSALDILKIIDQIETKLGRVKNSADFYTSRIIDIDIIFYGDCLFSSDELTVPHPSFRNRNFVLRPLADIDADRIDPLTQLSIQQLLRNNKDNSFIKVFENTKIIP